MWNYFHGVGACVQSPQQANRNSTTSNHGKLRFTKSQATSCVICYMEEGTDDMDVGVIDNDMPKTPSPILIINYNLAVVLVGGV